MEKNTRVFIITDDDGVRSWLENCLGRDKGIETRVFPSTKNLHLLIAKSRPHAILLDVQPGDFPAGSLDILRKNDAHLPVITLVPSSESAARAESLKRGACGIIGKPLSGEDETYHLLMNTIGAYKERQEALQIATEMKNRCEADSLNLLELELVKGLQHMIGETTDPVSIFKHSFSLIKNYLAFDVFAAFVTRGTEKEIYVYPNTAITPALAEIIPGTLMKKMTKLSEEDREIKVILHGSPQTGAEAPGDLSSLIVPLNTASRTYGYAGIYQTGPLNYHAESVFKRFCSHIATAIEKMALFEEVKALSVSDGLTGLANHRAIVSGLQQEVQRSERYGSPLSILILDVDDFKEVNDTHGHLAGDAVLIEIGKLLQTGVRGIDSIGRYGGEEFLVILPETEAEGAVAIGERLRQKVAAHEFAHEGTGIALSISCGVAVYRDGYDTSRFIGLADQNLYKAKTNGKNMVHYDEN